MTNYTKDVLDQFNIRLDKNKSQNYLIDNNKVEFILKKADIQEDDVILEIGAGIGTLTIPMAKKAKKVIAIEKDPVIADILEQQKIKNNLYNIEVIQEDALKIKYPSFNKVVSNLPYKISSPITFKLLNYPFTKAILMYQLEFAKRMQAKPGTHEYSRLTAALYFKADVEIINTLPPEAFIPKPKVKSAIIELIPKENVDLPLEYDNVLRALFQHRNKKVRKALSQSAHELNMDKKILKNKLNTITNPLLEKKVFQLTPEEIKNVSKIIEEII